MSLIGIIQPIIIHLCTTEEERHIETENLKEEEISQTTKFFFPVVITIIICLFASMGTALVGSLMAGNFIKESGVVPGITKALQGSFLYLITFCLGVAIGSTMQAGTFFSAVTLITLGLGFVAICCDTVVGIYGGKVMRFFDKGISPVAAAAGLSAFPLGAQGSQKASALYNPTDTTKWVGSQAFTINTGGQIQSVLAAVILFSMVVGLVAKGIGM